MSIILKGIDLPKDKDCVNLSIYSNGDVYEQAESGYYFRINADAIQIPKGHGRIGDLDELKVNVTKAMTYGDALHEVKHCPAILESEEE